MVLLLDRITSLQHTDTGRHRQSSLIDLDNAVYFTNKPETGKEPDCSCHEEEKEDHDGCIPKIEHCRHRSLNI